MQLASEICDRASALEFLLGRINYERTSMASYRSGEIKLDRMRDLLALLGDPQLAWPAIHVAGTKGKGSTSAMIASVLSQAGNRTGLYTSPHLERLEERLVIDGRQCSEAEFVRLAADVQGAVAQLDRQAAAVGDAADSDLSIFNFQFSIQNHRQWTSSPSPARSTRFRATSS